MRLRSLLTELTERERFVDLVNSEYMVPDKFLIRGSQYEIESYKEREIRKDRKPRDTEEKADVIIDGIEDGFYPSVPKRKESKFAATYGLTDEVEQYGDHIYFVFPHKDASVYSLPNDGISYFRSYLAFDLLEILRQLDYEKLPATLGFIETYRNTKVGGNLNKLYNYVRRNWGEMVEELKSYDSGDFSISQKATDTLVSVKAFVMNIEEYFDDMREGIHPPSPEVIFDGPKYVVVNQDFFSNNFTTKGNNVALI